MSRPICAALMACGLMISLSQSATAVGKRQCPCKTCCPKVEHKKVKKSCWEVECQEICIPRICFPWMKTRSCCDGVCFQPRCGRVIKVHKLKKKEYECGEKCEYKWEIHNRCIPSLPVCFPACDQPTCQPQAREPFPGQIITVAPQR
ncbi:MAG: hypothetical protein KatS3mg105_3966 [Gemmatales bacterium]|nr:MAG: hypothetical protein KatS3mg105_3966 [Gemmatales bacterium]